MIDLLNNDYNEEIIKQNIQRIVDMYTLVTTPEQSQVLMKSVNEKSADMHYVRKVKGFDVKIEEEPKWSQPKFGNPKSKYANYIIQDFDELEVIPAWSLSALMKIIPKIGNNLLFNYIDVRYAIYNSTAEPKWITTFENADTLIIAYNDNILDSVYDVVTDLIDNNIIHNGNT